MAFAGAWASGGIGDELSDTAEPTAVTSVRVSADRHRIVSRRTDSSFRFWDADSH